MIAVARYLLAEYVRSRRFVAPALVLVVVIGGLYASPPNPVLETAGSVAAYAFPIQAWLALTFFNTAGSVQRQLLSATTGGRTLVLGRLLAGAALAAMTTVLAVGYPVLALRFDHTPSLTEAFWCVLATLASAVAGTALAALFAQPLVRSRAVAVLGLAGCVLLTIPLELPPSIPTARALDTQRVSDVPSRLAGDLVSIAVFTVVAAITCSVLWRRAE